MSKNNINNLWAAFKKGCYPFIDGEQEKRLKVAFLQGIHSGKELVVQISRLPNDQMAETFRDLNEQVLAELSKLGFKPGKITVAEQKVSVKASIDGKPLN